MKVLSLREPFATLIKEKKKFVETRSWKTNYRGELYIHASLTKMKKEDVSSRGLLDLLNGKDLNFGYIICKCKLIDCIYMTKEYVENMKKNHQEYICGRYEEGRYAWVLEDIETLIEPIKVKGCLGIWNLYDELDIMDIMQKIDYGWVSKDKNKYKSVDDNFSDNYRLQSPKEILKRKIGVCWDQVELERFLFSKSLFKFKTYFLVHYDGKSCPTHTFLTFEKDGKNYWFEHSWEAFRGIREYASEEDLLKDVKDKFINFELGGKYKKENLQLHEYERPKFDISVQEFYSHCERGKQITF